MGGTEWQNFRRLVVTRARLTVKFGGWEYFAKVKRRHHWPTTARLWIYFSSCYVIDRPNEDDLWLTSLLPSRVCWWTLIPVFQTRTGHGRALELWCFEKCNFANEKLDCHYSESSTSCAASHLPSFKYQNHVQEFYSSTQHYKVDQTIVNFMVQGTLSGWDLDQLITLFKQHDSNTHTGLFLFCLYTLKNLLDSK